MLKKMSLFLALALVLVLPYTLWAKPVTLTVQIGSQLGTPAAKFWLDEWAKPIEEMSKGEIKINFVGGHAITRAEGAYYGVVDQSIDISEFSPNHVSKELPHLTLMHMPFVATDSIKGTELLYHFKETIPEFAAEWERDLHVLSGWALDRSGFMATKGLVKTPADVKNKRVLVFGVGVVSDEVKAWGGDPIFVNPPDSYVGLQRGMGEMVWGQILSFRPMKFNEVAKYLTVAPLEVQTLYLGINKDFWKSLTDEQRDIITKHSGKEYALKYAHFMYNLNQESLILFQEDGVEVLELDEQGLEPFKSMVIEGTKPYWTRTLTQGGIKDTEAWISKIYAISEEFHKK